MNLRVRSTEAALDLLRLLRYDARPRPYDAREIGLDVEGVRLFSDGSRSRGYGILIAEVDEPPASLRTFARRLSERFHDSPVAFLGIKDGAAGWKELMVIRPRTIAGGGGAVSVARLTIDVAHPTAHDAAVVDGLEWDPLDPRGSQKRIDEALDVERVTRRFFTGLNEHYRKVLAAVAEAGQTSSPVLAGIREAGGEERVALRIVTQLLFCYFLQRKGLLDGDRAWLTHAYRRNAAHGDYYADVLEPLFYEALAKPVGDREAPWDRVGFPFLNGGLFERHYGDVSLPLTDELFSADDGLLGFLDSWTFTVSEEPADESEVAVDPEMLGKVFESLVAEEDLRREGTVYTPRPVVQFMCREALVPYLEREAGLGEEQVRTLLLEDDAFARLEPARSLEVAAAIDAAVERISVIDPGVGSGAFLLGMLSELVRLRRLALQARAGRAPGAAELWDWKRNAIERSLFGVDINPTAIELCRLRLWLSLLIEEEPGKVVPLPNLEYRVLSADALRDFVAGYEVQQTRGGELTLGFDIPDPTALVKLREEFYETADPAEKSALRRQLADEEQRVVESILDAARSEATSQIGSRAAAAKKRGQSALEEQLPMLEAAFRSRDRVFPAFMPGFHAPEVAAEGGWDVVIMNPPYVGRKEVAQRFDESYRHDLELHYGRTSDLMLLFGRRALELARDGGVISMIFNDSIFTSVDAADFRRRILGDLAERSLRAVARTRCFENVAVNGGVIVAVDAEPDGRMVRYVENHGRQPAELVRASGTIEGAGPHPAGDSEVWLVGRNDLQRLPHRPLFRPSPEAIECLDRFEECAFWDEFRRFEAPRGADWEMLSETKRLDRWRDEQRRGGGYRRLLEFRFVLLGLVIEGGQGLATADDRRFLAAIDGTEAAERAEAMCVRLAEMTREKSEPATLLEGELAAGSDLATALLVVADTFRPSDLGWPKSGTVRTAEASKVAHRQLSPDEIADGLDGAVTFVPFEKGDDSTEGGGARWRRDNPIVIDWSRESVALLRARASQATSYRKPYFRNEALWTKPGITWNAISSYFRLRAVPEGSIFGHGSPVVVPVVEWLTPESLLAICNAPVADFVLRTFLCSRMNTHVGDIRRFPIPVLTDSEAERLHDLGARGIAAKEAEDHGGSHAEIAAIEDEVDAVTRELYGIPKNADLWVVR